MTNEHKLDWLYQPGRTPIFQKWMDSLTERTVRRARVLLPNTYDNPNKHRNFASPVGKQW